MLHMHRFFAAVLSQVPGRCRLGRECALCMVDALIKRVAQCMEEQCPRGNLCDWNICALHASTCLPCALSAVCNAHSRIQCVGVLLAEHLFLQLERLAVHRC